MRLFLGLLSSTKYIFLLLMICSTIIFAARPFVADDAGTVGHGTFELETTANYLNAERTLGVSLKHGITGKMDIGLCFGHCKLPDQPAVYTGAAIGLKYALIPDWFSASFGTEFGSSTYSFTTILSHGLGPFSADVNIGFAATAATNHAELTCGASGVYHYKKFGIGAEICGTQHSISWWQVGVRYLVFNWLQFDSGLGGGFDQAADLAATTGLLFAFPVSKE